MVQKQPTVLGFDRLRMNSQNPMPNVMPGVMEMNSIKTEVQPVIVGPSAGHQPTIDDDKILSKKRLQELVKEIDPNEQLDDDVEDMLMQITDDFIESVVNAGCDLAKHRNGTILEVKDLKLHLENRWNITVPGYASDEIRAFKKPTSTEAHRQRLALIRKASKKS